VTLRTSCEVLRLAIRAPQRSPNRVIQTPRRGRLPNGKGRSGRPSDEVPAYSGKARGQAVKGHEVGGNGELGREAARERNRAAVLEEIARKLRGREGTAATD